MITWLRQRFEVAKDYLGYKIAEFNHQGPPFPQVRLSKLTKQNRHKQLAALLKNKKFSSGAFFGSYDPDGPEAQTLRTYMTPYTFVNDDLTQWQFELKTAAVYLEADTVNNQKLYGKFVGLMQNVLPFGPAGERSGGLSVCLFGPRLSQRVANRASEQWFESAFAHGAPEPEAGLSVQERIKQADLDHYAAILDQFLAYIDRPWQSMGIDLPDPDNNQIRNRQNTVVNTALYTNYPTSRLRTLIDTGIKNGYTITDDQKKQYNKQYGGQVDGV